jgi:hypothetical protein
MNALSRWVAKAKYPGATRHARAFWGKVEFGFRAKCDSAGMFGRFLFPVGVRALYGAPVAVSTCGLRAQSAIGAAYPGTGMHRRG